MANQPKLKRASTELRKSENPTFQVSSGGGGRGQGSNFPLPVPFTPGSHPFPSGHHLPTLFLFKILLNGPKFIPIKQPLFPSPVGYPPPLYTQVPALCPPPKLVQCVISLPRDVICDFVEPKKKLSI